MIVVLMGIIALAIIILLLYKSMNNKEKYSVIIMLLIWGGIPIAIAIIILGIFQPTKMTEWKVKEAIEPTLLNNEEDNIFDGYTYQYIIPERWSTNPNIIYYTSDTLFENVPILVKCERKGEPTIWTLGIGKKETKYVFYNLNGTINYLPECTIN